MGPRFIKRETNNRLANRNCHNKIHRRSLGLWRTKYLSRMALMSFLPMHAKRISYLTKRVTYTMSSNYLLDE